jgi:hypothetical protein
MAGTTTGLPSTAGTGVLGTTGISTGFAAGVARAAIPGVQANCGPIHLELGPIDEAQSSLSFHLDRLVVDLAAPEGMVSSVNALMCSADAALAGAAGISGTTATSQTPTNTAVSGATTPNGSTAATAGSNVAGGTPLQVFVATLNQLVAAMGG